MVGYVIAPVLILVLASLYNASSKERHHGKPLGHCYGWLFRSSSILMLTFAIGAVLRLWLAIVNTEANDNHLPVIRTIAFDHRVPAREEAWEAFQPKLYHTTVALLWQLVPNATSLTLIRIAQLVSCAAGILTLAVILHFLRERRLRPVVSLLTFGSVALSPALIGSAAQATNDSFVILFATLTLYFGARFFARWQRRDLIPLVLSAVLAGVSKGNGLVVIVAVLTTFGLAIVWPALAAPTPNRRSAFLYGGAFALVVLPAVWFIGPYASFERQYGTPFVTNWTPSSRPSLVHETYVDRPGLTSIAHGLFTFRFVDLLQHPVSTAHPTNYPRHRTSLWTRVYAQTHAARFEGWPRSWRSTAAAVLDLNRVLFVLGMIPTTLLAVGVVSTARSLVRHGQDRAASILWLVALAGYMAFVAVYSIRLRDYSSMKGLFVLPAALAGAALLSAGISSVLTWSERGRRHRRVFARSLLTGFAILLITYAADISLLVRDLSRRDPLAPLPTFFGRGDKP